MGWNEFVEAARGKQKKNLNQLRDVHDLIDSVTFTYGYALGVASKHGEMGRARDELKHTFAKVAKIASKYDREMKAFL